MSDNVAIGVLIATVAGFIGSGIYYSIFGDRLAAAVGEGTIPEARPWTYGVEFARTLIVAIVTASIASMADIGSSLGGAALGLALWVGFPVVLLVGAMVHEGTRLSLAAIHGGDWLFKLVIIGVIIGWWL
jgi:hypothetical protein